MALSVCTMDNYQNLELSDEATKADALDYPRTPVYRTRRAGYTLNQKKLLKNLKISLTKSSDGFSAFT